MDVSPFSIRIPILYPYPHSLSLVTAFLLLLATYAAILLRISAKRHRRHVLRDLRERLAIAQVPGQSVGSGGARRLEQLIADIKDERSGAFCPIGENPVLRAVLIPSGGLGTLAVLQQLLGGS